MIGITGARGFVGSRLVAHLQAAGAPFRVIGGDVRDAASVRDQAQGCAAIVHLAARHVDRGEGFAVNVDGTRAALDTAEAVGARLVTLSSTGVYGHRPHADATEGTPIAPDTALSRSRAAADALIVDRHRAGRVAAVILRPRFVYGHGDRAVLPRVHRAASRSPVWVDGGRARLSVVWVDDLARVLFAATQAPVRDGDPVFHVTDGAPVTFRALAERLCALLGGRTPRWSVPLGLVLPPVALWERVRGIDPETSSRPVSSIRLRLAAQDQWFSSARLAAWLDVPFTPLDEGLRQSRAWYRSLAGSGAAPATGDAG